MSKVVRDDRLAAIYGSLDRGGVTADGLIDEVRGKPDAIDPA
jgi:hypothetical protein